MKKRSWTIGLATLVISVATSLGPSSAQDGQSTPPVEKLGDEGPIEEIEALGRRPVTATSTMTIPADSFDLRLCLHEVRCVQQGVHCPRAPLPCG